LRPTVRRSGHSDPCCSFQAGATSGALPTGDQTQGKSAIGGGQGQNTQPQYGVPAAKAAEELVHRFDGDWVVIGLKGGTMTVIASADQRSTEELYRQAAPFVTGMATT
jgi:hypothetical protein